MRSITHIIFYCVAVFTFVILPIQTYAQGIPTSPSGIEISLSSNNPVPGQQVTVTAKSFSTDIDAATIVWTVNGTEVKRGVGQTTIIVTAPTLGKKTNVTVAAITVGGKTLTNSVSIGSGSIDIITETSGYVPVFFMGKLAPVLQNSIKIVAIPHIADSNGVEYNPANLVYKWEKDGIVLGNDSGYGKQTLTISGTTVPRPFSITVTATTRDSSRQAKTITDITYTDPTLRFYANDPLYGPLFNRQLSGRVFLSTQRELGVLAVPFGFDKPNNNIGSLALSWLINGTERTSLSQNESIIIRSPENSFGTSDIGLRIQDPQHILQRAENAFTVSFKASTDGSASEDISF